MKAFIEANFKMIDIDGDGVVGVNEFRYNCIQRLATDDIKVVDEAYNQLVNVSEVPTQLHDNKQWYLKLEKFSAPPQENLIVNFSD